MSMCFFHENVLYADRYQIADYDDYIPRLVDNKIFVSSNKKVILAAMGRVPKNTDDFMERLERAMMTFIEESNRKKTPFDELHERLKKSIELLESNFMGVFINRKQTPFLIKSYGAGKSKEIIVGGCKTMQMFCPRNTNELLALGIPPADIFRGASIHKGVISKEHTAYDIKLKKFIPTYL